MLISYVNTKAFNKNNISEAEGYATKNINISSVKMLLSSYTAEKSVKVIHLPDSGTDEHTDL